MARVVRRRKQPEPEEAPQACAACGGAPESVWDSKLNPKPIVLCEECVERYANGLKMADYHRRT